MRYTYKLHPDIQKDYADAYAWYEDKLAGLGDRFIIAIRQKIEEIIHRPEVFGSKGKVGYREAKVDFFPYLIVYKVYKERKEIFISSIHHTSKKPRKKYRK